LGRACQPHTPFFLHFLVSLVVNATGHSRAEVRVMTGGGEGGVQWREGGGWRWEGGGRRNWAMSRGEGGIRWQECSSRRDRAANREEGRAVSGRLGGMHLEAERAASGNGMVVAGGSKLRAAEGRAAADEMRARCEGRRWWEGRREGRVPRRHRAREREGMRRRRGLWKATLAGEREKALACWGVGGATSWGRRQRPRDCGDGGIAWGRLDE
jgi:hypothetical protein